MTCYKINYKRFIKVLWDYLHTNPEKIIKRSEVEDVITDFSHNATMSEFVPCSISKTWMFEEIESDLILAAGPAIVENFLIKTEAFDKILGQNKKNLTYSTTEKIEMFLDFLIASNCFSRNNFREIQFTRRNYIFNGGFDSQEALNNSNYHPLLRNNAFKDITEMSIVKNFRNLGIYEHQFAFYWASPLKSLNSLVQNFPEIFEKATKLEDEPSMRGYTISNFELPQLGHFLTMQEYQASKESLEDFASALSITKVVSKSKKKQLKDVTYVEIDGKRIALQDDIVTYNTDINTILPF